MSGPGGLAAFLRTRLTGDQVPAASLPLDTGTPTSLITGGLRRAVITRDRHCAFPGCDTPPAACQVHHLTPKASGGLTKLTNLVLLCAFHHLIAVHQWGWTLTLHADGTLTAVSPTARAPCTATAHHSEPPEPGGRQVSTVKPCVPSRSSCATSPYSQSRYACMAAGSNAGALVGPPVHVHRCRQQLAVARLQRPSGRGPGRGSAGQRGATHLGGGECGQDAVLGRQHQAPARPPQVGAQCPGRAGYVTGQEPAARVDVDDPGPARPQPGIQLVRPDQRDRRRRRNGGPPRPGLGRVGAQQHHLPAHLGQPGRGHRRPAAGVLGQHHEGAADRGVPVGLLHQLTAGRGPEPGLVAGRVLLGDRTSNRYTVPLRVCAARPG